ncbi:MAG: hypothetical protein WCS10_04225 [Bacteroidales bacterium]
MKKIIFIIIVFVSILGFYGCEYEIDYKGDLPKDKLVVASFIEKDSIISFSLFKSAKPGTYNNEDIFDSEESADSYADFISSYVTNAKAELYIDGVLAQTLLQATSNNTYTFNTIPRQNQEIEIKLSYKDFNQAIGRANLNLIQPIIDSSSITIQEGISSFGLKIYRAVIYLEIRDNGLDNYYQIDPNLIYENLNDTTKISLSNAELLWENIQGVYQENLSAYETGVNRFGVLSNKKFKGSVYKIKLAIRLNVDEDSPFRKLTQRLYGNLNVASIEKHAFDYLFTLNRNYNSSYMNEPVIILDGIENAYGFIGGKCTKRVDNINITF